MHKCFYVDGQEDAQNEEINSKEPDFNLWVF
jgi:hypothetical protein